MLSRILPFFAVFALFPATSIFAEEFDAAKILKRDVGTWNVVIKMFGDPNAEPVQSKGTEINFMLGDKWLISHFKGEVVGTAFEGSGQFGYDPKSKKMIGSWVDSMSPFPTKMEGTWDENSQSLTSIGTGFEPDGKESKTKMVSAYKNDGTRTFTMYGIMEGKEVKMMEFHYTKIAKPEEKK